MSGRYKPEPDGGETICLCPSPWLDGLGVCDVCRRKFLPELSPGTPRRPTQLVEVPRPPPPDLGTFTMVWDEAG